MMAGQAAPCRIEYRGRVGVCRRIEGGRTVVRQDGYSPCPIRPLRDSETATMGNERVQRTQSDGGWWRRVEVANGHRHLPEGGTMAVAGGARTLSISPGNEEYAGTETAKGQGRRAAQKLYGHNGMSRQLQGWHGMRLERWTNAPATKRLDNFFVAAIGRIRRCLRLYTVDRCDPLWPSAVPDSQRMSRGMQPRTGVQSLQ